jgi:hypothetical protein
MPLSGAVRASWRNAFINEPLCGFSETSFIAAFYRAKRARLIKERRMIDRFP